MRVAIDWSLYGAQMRRNGNLKDGSTTPQIQQHAYAYQAYIQEREYWVPSSMSVLLPVQFLTTFFTECHSSEEEGHACMFSDHFILGLGFDDV